MGFHSDGSVFATNYLLLLVFAGAYFDLRWAPGGQHFDAYLMLYASPMAAGSEYIINMFAYCFGLFWDPLGCIFLYWFEVINWGSACRTIGSVMVRSIRVLSCCQCWFAEFLKELFSLIFVSVFCFCSCSWLFS